MGRKLARAVIRSGDIALSVCRRSGRILSQISPLPTAAPLAATSAAAAFRFSDSLDLIEKAIAQKTMRMTDDVKEGIAWLERQSYLEDTLLHEDPDEPRLA